MGGLNDGTRWSRRRFANCQHGACAERANAAAHTYPHAHNAQHPSMAGITFGNFRGKGCECSKCEGVVLCAARNLLPDTIKPRHYTLLIHPDLDKHTFSGHVEIAVEATAASSVIVLHAHELAIQKASFAVAAGDVTPCVVGSFETEEQSVPITLAAPMAAGEKGVLSLDFTGILNDQLAGFYRTKYTSSAGEERYGAVTQFEATDARRAFPCFDEPALKATFDVTLRVRTDRISLSNMPAIKTVPTSAVDAAGNAHHDVTYATTPKMSTSRRARLRRRRVRECGRRYQGRRDSPRVGAAG